MLALVGTLVATTVLGGLIGYVSGRVTTEPPGSDTPPPFAAEFPNGERQFMTGVTLDVVVEDWMKKANSWKCTDKETDPSNNPLGKRVTECNPPDDDSLERRVRVEYDAEDKIRMVEATCRSGLKTNACTTLAATLADAVLSPQGDNLAKQAEKWARENADSERATTIGGILLQASLNPHGMTATPAP